MEDTKYSSEQLNKLVNSRVENELAEILDCIEVGVFITDGNGDVIMLNKRSLDYCLFDEENLVGRNVRDLVAEKVFEDALSIKVMETGKTVSTMQKGITDRYDLLVTAVPLFEGKEIKKVILTERDVTELNRLQGVLEKNIELNLRYEEEVEYYRKKSVELEELIYKSSSMAELVNTVIKIASVDATVLIQGESGTGKTLLAKLIHKNSNRNRNPFIEINCGAIPENLLESELFGYVKGAFTGAVEKGKIGLFELASGGTLFLDEIGTLSPHLQIKVLRAIQEKEIMRIGSDKYTSIDIRIIAASNLDLQQAVNSGNFRKDLYYRLNVIPLNIPPLYERREDIMSLSEHFLKKLNAKYNAEKMLSSSALKMLFNYNWPGNVRELENVLERVVITTEKSIISGNDILAMLPVTDREMHREDNSGISLKEETNEFEKSLIKSKMPKAKSISELARQLGVDKSTMIRKLKKHELKLK